MLNNFAAGGGTLLRRRTMMQTAETEEDDMTNFVLYGTTEITEGQTYIQVPVPPDYLELMLYLTLTAPDVTAVKNVRYYADVVATSGNPDYLLGNATSLYSVARIAYLHIKKVGDKAYSQITAYGSSLGATLFTSTYKPYAPEDYISVNCDGETLITGTIQLYYR